MSLDLAAYGCLVLLALALGWAVARVDGFQASMADAVSFTAAGLACVAVVMVGPVACVAAIAAVMASGLAPDIAQFGELDFTLADVFYAGLVGWWLLAIVRRTQQRPPTVRPRVSFGQGVAILFLAYAGLTVGKVAISDPGGLGNSLVSWLRLVQTASLAFLAASVIETKRDVRMVLSATAAAAVVGVAVGALAGGDLLVDRSKAGSLGPNVLGLLSGLLLLIAAFGGVTRKAQYRIVLAAIAVVGLLLAKSVASFVATGLVLALGASLVSTSPRAANKRAMRAVLAFSLAGILVFSLVQFLRPEATPNSSSFRESSTAQRIILGATGLEIFAHNPIIGAGWRQSSSPAVTGDREIALEIRRRFPDARPAFYPDVNPGSVHNTYVQVLADLGSVGFVLFVAMIVAIARRVMQLLRRLGRDHELWPQASVMALSLLLVLIWLNDNPLFGGQPETVIPVIFVGALAAMTRMTSGYSSDEPALTQTAAAGTGHSSG